MGIHIQAAGLALTVIVSLGIPATILAYKLAKSDIIRETAKMLDKRYVQKSECINTHKVSNVMLKALHDDIQENKTLSRQILDAVLHSKKSRRKVA